MQLEPNNPYLPDIEKELLEKIEAAERTVEEEKAKNSTVTKTVPVSVPVAGGVVKTTRRTRGIVSRIF